MGVETQGTRDEKVRNNGKGTALVAQWSRPRASNAGGAASTRGWGTKIPHAVWLSQRARKKDDRDRMRDMERTTQMENQCDSDYIPSPAAFLLPLIDSQTHPAQKLTQQTKLSQ